MHLEVLVEEASMETTLRNILPRLLPAHVTFMIHPFQGKQNLLKKLQNRLRGYVYYRSSDDYIIVLVDADREDCRAVKARLESVASSVGLSTLSNARARGNTDFQVINRVVVEELEAWFFGDNEALRAAFPRISDTLTCKEKFRFPDDICNTAEEFEKVLKRAGYYTSGLPKKEAAQKISQYMEPDRNLSKSFCAFRDAVRSLPFP
jgi:hypothetical protein